jgi:subtilisin family serine protease
LHAIWVVAADRFPQDFFDDPRARAALSSEKGFGVGRVFFPGDAQPPVVVTDVLLVRFTAPHEDALQTLVSRPEFGLIDQVAGPPRTFRIRNLSGKDSIEVSRQLGQRPDIDACQPDVLRWAEELADPAGEPDFGEQWYLDNEEVPAADLNVIEAWKLTTGDPSVTIAILDSGFYPEHVDLEGRIIDTWDFTLGTSDVKSGRKPDHGQAVAGLALGAANGKHIAGVCPDCTGILISLNYVSSDLIAALYRARYEGADVISISSNWGTPDPQLSDALADVGKTVPIFAAAGNEGPSKVCFPASETFAIGGFDCKNQIYRAQQYDDEKLEIVAPTKQTDGTCGLIALGPDAVIRGFGGTSAATPLVAGVAALVLSLDPERPLDPASVYDILIASTSAPDPEACPVHPGFNPACGYGNVDAGKAVAAAGKL